MPNCVQPSDATVLLPERDYFAMYTGARYDYETRFEGNFSTIWWVVRKNPEMNGEASFTFPVEDGDFVDNDYWAGHAFSGRKGLLFAALGPDENFHLVADVAAAQATKWVLPEAKRVYTHLGFEDVVTPFSRYAACFKLEISESLLAMDGQVSRSTSYLYFAQGMGLVKVGFPDGEIVLKAFFRQADAAPPPPKRPTQEVGIDPDRQSLHASLAPNSARKPWWKFWK